MRLIEEDTADTFKSVLDFDTEEEQQAFDRWWDITGDSKFWQWYADNKPREQDDY